MSLLAPLPDNMRFVATKGRPTAIVESDLFSVAERVKEINPDLVIVFHQTRKDKQFAVMENCADGVTRFVKAYDELDARVLEDLRYMLSVPFDKRVAELERQEKLANERQGKMTEGQMQEYADQFKRELKKAGMIDPLQDTLYPLKPKKV